MTSNFNFAWIVEKDEISQYNIYGSFVKKITIETPNKISQSRGDLIFVTQKGIFYKEEKTSQFTELFLQLLLNSLKAKQPLHMHIAIAGNIGAGKTTLTKLLSKHFKWTPQYEDVVDNPYLDDFYNEMERWSFNLQIYFLNSRFRQLLDIRDSKKTIIQDRTI